MKPKELPFYDDISDSSGIPLSMDEKQTSPLKEGVSKYVLNCLVKLSVGHMVKKAVDISIHTG